MSVLSDSEIRQAVKADRLIDPFDRHALQGASYDMRLGPLMVVQGVPQEVEMRRGTSYSLHPGEFVVLTTLEHLKLPIDLIGHNGIMSPWARRGLVSLFSPQIDPGFEGPLEVPVFNAGDADVVLIPGTPMFTVEFVRMSSAASYLWVDKNRGPKKPPSEPLPPKASRLNLQDISEIAERHTLLEQAIDKAKVDASQQVVEVKQTLQDLEKEFAVFKSHVEGRLGAESDRAQRQGVTLGRRQALLAVVAILVALGLGLAGLLHSSSKPAPPAPTTTVTTTSQSKSGS